MNSGWNFPRHAACKVTAKVQPRSEGSKERSPPKLFINARDTYSPRVEDQPETHGPSRLSLLYLAADGVAAVQALYVENNLKPKAIAIIQPGHAFGGHWTDFTGPEQVLARTVHGNPAGMPEYLLFGGWHDNELYRNPCWPSYRHQVRFLKTANVGIWSLRKIHPPDDSLATAAQSSQPTLSAVE